MQWGNEQEEFARELYTNRTGREIMPAPSTASETVPHFASSPDGIYYNVETGERGCIEIKCPMITAFIKYVPAIKDNETMKKVVPDYFYQVQSHMHCVGCNWCDFVVFQPFMRKSMNIVRITRDDAEIAAITERVEAANMIVEQIIREING
jgi:hypothetical protein